MPRADRASLARAWANPVMLQPAELCLLLGTRWGASGPLTSQLCVQGMTQAPAPNAPGQGHTHRASMLPRDEARHPGAGGLGCSQCSPPAAVTVGPLPKLHLHVCSLLATGRPPPPQPEASSLWWAVSLAKHGDQRGVRGPRRPVLPAGDTWLSGEPMAQPCSACQGDYPGPSCARLPGHQGWRAEPVGLSP